MTAKHHGASLSTPEDLKLWHKICETITPIERRDALKTHNHIHITHPPKRDPLNEPPQLRLEPFNLGENLRPKGESRLITAFKETPDPIEPGRKRRIERERDDIEAVLDLHGLNAIQAETIVKSFVSEASLRGYRAVMIITGKGQGRNGVLKSQTPLWLAEPRLRSIIAGISQAHPRHGGAGALYVALKRKP
jgi:DNA-nicking Smr family endonuclease